MPVHFDSIVSDVTVLPERTGSADTAVGRDSGSSRERGTGSMPRSLAEDSPRWPSLTLSRPTSVSADSSSSFSSPRTAAEGFDD